MGNIWKSSHGTIQFCLHSRKQLRNLMMPVRHRVGCVFRGPSSNGCRRSQSAGHLAVPTSTGVDGRRSGGHTRHRHIEEGADVKRGSIIFGAPARPARRCWGLGPRWLAGRVAWHPRRGKAILGQAKAIRATGGRVGVGDPPVGSIVMPAPAAVTASPCSRTVFDEPLGRNPALTIVVPCWSQSS